MLAACAGHDTCGAQAVFAPRPFPDPLLNCWLERVSAFGALQSTMIQAQQSSDRFIVEVRNKRGVEWEVDRCPSW
jgi:hypothetical protein